MENPNPVIWKLASITAAKEGQAVLHRGAVGSGAGWVPAGEGDWAVPVGAAEWDLTEHMLVAPWTGSLNASKPLT